MKTLTLTQDDNDLIVMLSSSRGCSLDSSPGKNWVERGGGLPNYICKVAKGIMRSGKPKGQAIAIAISRIKKWAAGGDGVDADTQAKAATAAAQWETLKVKNKSKKVSLSRREADGAEYLLLSNIPSFDTDRVRRAWDTKEQQRRAEALAAYRVAHALPSSEYVSDLSVPYTWIKELWTDHLIINIDGPEGPDYARVDYTVNGDDVEFGEPVPIKQAWVVEDEEDLTDNERALLADLALSASTHPAVSRIIGVSETLRP